MSRKKVAFYASTAIIHGMNRILSIQSHVAYGYVGNDAAKPVLQSHGFDVIDINTVQFSNHTGYGSWTGTIYPPEAITEIIRGVKERNALKGCNALLSGYLGSAETGQSILDALKTLKSENPQAIYICDPVMGDIGRGFFVRDGIPEFFKTQIIPQADILTPNLFELAALTDQKPEELNSFESIKHACRSLHDKGVHMVLVTSLITEDMGASEIGLLLSQKNGTIDINTHPLVYIDPAPNGAGDATAACFAAHILKGEQAKVALKKTAHFLHTLFKNTKEAGSRELALMDSLRSDS